MSDLTDWLRERIAEDEAVAREMLAAEAKVADLPTPPPYVFATDEDPADFEPFLHVLRHDPARVLAQCAAFRRIVELHRELFWFAGGNHETATGKCRMCAENEESDYDGAPLVAWPCPTLRALASIYADHPEFRQEWL